MDVSCSTLVAKVVTALAVGLVRLIAKDFGQDPPLIRHAGHWALGTGRWALGPVALPKIGTGHTLHPWDTQ